MTINVKDAADMLRDQAALLDHIADTLDPASAQPAPGPAPAPAPISLPAPQSAAGLVITLALAEGSLTFDEASALVETYADELTGKPVTIKTMKQYPWIVRTFHSGWSDGVDIALSYGGRYSDTWAAGTSEDYLKPYTLHLDGADKPYSWQSDASGHRWGATALFEIGTWPALATADDLVAKGLVPNFDRTVKLGPVNPAPPYQPMGYSGLSPAEGGTGDRPEIGLLHENEAAFLVTGNDLQSVLDLAKGMGSFSTHITARDDAPLDLTKFPKINFYGAYSTPPVALGDSAVEAIDQAHVNHEGYLAFLLQRRPYFLRRATDMATFVQARQAGNLQVICGDAGNQVRGDAWVLLWAVYMYMASPPAAGCPSYLLPREYWLAQLRRHGAWFDLNMMKPCADVKPWQGDGYLHYGLNTKNQAFHSATAVMETSFKEFYLGAVMGFIATRAAKFPDLQDWMARFAWKVQFSIDRSSGLTAWDRRFTAFYYLTTYTQNGQPLADPSKAVAGVPVVAITDYALLFDVNKPQFDLTAPADKPWVDPKVGANYLEYIRMELIYAAEAKLANVGLSQAYSFIVPAGQVPVVAYRMALAEGEAP